MTSAGPSNHQPANERERKRASCQAGELVRGVRAQDEVLRARQQSGAADIFHFMSPEMLTATSASLVGWAGKQVGIF